MHFVLRYTLVSTGFQPGVSNFPADDNRFNGFHYILILIPITSNILR